TALDEPPDEALVASQIRRDRQPRLRCQRGQRAPRQGPGSDQQLVFVAHRRHLYHRPVGARCPALGVQPPRLACGDPLPMSITVVAEKPSVARDLARVLGATNKADGYLEGNGYRVTWAIGHLVALA